MKKSASAGPKRLVLILVYTFRNERIRNFSITTGKQTHLCVDVRRIFLHIF